MADCTRQGVTVPISRVTLIADDNASYTAGTDAGAELSASCPWATQEMADRLLTEVAGKSIAGFLLRVRRWTRRPSWATV